ncbi:GrpB family protein [Deinococcus budaensis]|uniref:GrpB-like predicted nucleotidyltransferase (UPF0157 family) n=1 Tax=Deinococcus budaensis TaxID=1665626 RepID=A0A7W8GC76_9DEIO|nr:GrpB family protein [Deinococcus budaensis]MBB5232651.1 GrpB-like predicted nucleotidyltransferase (UPF0157 family) [Deinococcus budaensis]
MTLGLRRGTVELRPSSAEYPGLFAQERGQVARALGPLAVAVEHVGSTSVPGLAAKPILDLAVGVEDAARLDACIRPLEQIGYASFGDREGWGEYFFAKGPDEARTHYLHLMPVREQRWRDYLLFRDVLRACPDLRDEYQALKTALAREHGAARAEYTARKGAFVEGILAEFRSVGVEG